MRRSTLEGYEQLARGLGWAAWLVLLLAIIGAILIAGSDVAVPGFEDVTRQGRGVAALASLGGGLTAAGILSALGAILRMLVADRLERLGPAATEEEAPRGRRDPHQPEPFNAGRDDEPGADIDGTAAGDAPAPSGSRSSGRSKRA